MPPNPHSTPLGREARNKTHTEAQTNITHTTTNNGIERTEKTLRKRNDSPTGRRCPARRPAGPQWPRTRRLYGSPRRAELNRMVCYKKLHSKRRQWICKKPASRTKNVRFQGRSPTVHENGPLERRAADTAWDDTAEENRWETYKMWHRSTLYVQNARWEVPSGHYAKEYRHSRP